jgi:hypothetical protein
MIRDMEVKEIADLPKVPKAFGVIDEDRQVVAIISSDSPDDQGQVLVPAGCDFQRYMKPGARAVLWEHNKDEPVAKCLEIVVKADRIEAVAQFPPPGISRKADEVFDMICRGSASCTSVGYTRPKDSSLWVPEWELFEWSFCHRRGANPRARVVGIGGRRPRRKWDDRDCPRLPTYDEAGGSPEHLASAIRRYDELRAAARWRQC